MATSLVPKKSRTEGASGVPPPQLVAKPKNLVVERAKV